MKISEKCFKRCNLLICLFPIIYYIISDNFHVNKYVKFLMVILSCLYTMLLGTGYHLSNKPIKKKDLIGLIFANLFMIIIMICWYVKFVY